MALAASSCSQTESTHPDLQAYTSFSRFTEPGDFSSMLDPLPNSPLEIAAIARKLTIHHNLLAYFDIPRNRWSEMQSVWPPKSRDILAALSATGPGDLLGERESINRVRGACMLESHFLAGLLRYKNIPIRLRAGYFRDVYRDDEHVIAFWERISRAKGIARELLEEDPDEWLRVNHEFTRDQIEVNKCVEHWVVEYWDTDSARWQLLDANRDFLKAMSDIDVDYKLPRKHFEFAYEAWQYMRTSAEFNPAQFIEWPQEGRSHIRSQLLWDFYSLLNHDIAGYDKSLWPDADTLSTSERMTYSFVKERLFEDLTEQELRELDELAALLSQEPKIAQLVEFYHKSRTLKIKTIESDPLSFVYR